MPDEDDKHPRGVPGYYFTDLSCIDCTLCREIAPEVFKSDDEGLTYVWRQPRESAELDRAEEARECCPTETIGREPCVGTSRCSAVEGEPTG